MILLKFKTKLFYCFVINLLFLFSCTVHSDSEVNALNSNFNQTTIGTGSFDFSYQSPTSGKVLKVYYHIPETRTNQSKVLLVFHGVNRNALDYRNALISKANQYNFILIVPEFSTTNFPGPNGYNYGNVYQDGENPTVNALNPESSWSFSIVEPLFDYVKSNLGNNNNFYYIFGHSAGAQFVHRLFMFKPQVRALKSVISAAGVYTFPNISINFPYGYNQSILLNSNKAQLYGKNVYLQVGSLDNNPNSSNLLHNVWADAQGLHRLERATNFFNFCQLDAQNLNLEFNWTFMVRPNATHDYISAGNHAAEILFN
jgi:hypothetical protein